MATIDGTPDRDVLVGTDDDDVLNGFEGDDVLEGGVGADQLLGGSGFDFAVYYNSSVGVAGGPVRSARAAVMDWALELHVPQISENFSPLPKT